MLDGLIGNTPMIKIKYKYKGIIKNIYAKLEYYNYTGSIKDRIAYYIIKKSKEEGILKDEQPIIEATSGNTGISFAALGALFGHKVHIFMPDFVSLERRKILKLYGAYVYLVSKEEGGFKECIKRADDLRCKINGFRPNQFSNLDNILAHYNTTAKEIIDSVPYISSFVSGIGTGGTLMGVGKRLKEIDPNIKVIALEPDKMALLSGGKVKKNHKIEGIGDDFIPDIVDTSIIDKVISINDNDAIRISQILASKFGLGVGISSGASILACIKSELDNVVTVLPDDLKKYLSTDLCADIKYDRFIDEIEFLDIDLV